MKLPIHLHNRLSFLLKPLLGLGLIHVCLCLISLSSFANDVILIKENDIKPYRSAIDGIKSSCSCTIREFYLSDSDGIEEALKEHPAAVVTVGTKAFRKARGIKTIPLVYTMAMPEDTTGPLPENVSGVGMDIAPGDYLDAITGIFPDVKRIGLLYDPENTGPFVREAEAAAREKRITLIAKPVSNARRIPDLLDQLRKTTDVFWMLPDKTLINPDSLDYLMLISFQSNLPVFAFSPKYLDRGAAAALSVDPLEMGSQAGKLVKRLAAGGGAAVRLAPRNAKLIVNRKVCTKLGVRINEEVAQRAEKVTNP